LSLLLLRLSLGLLLLALLFSLGPLLLRLTGFFGSACLLLGGLFGLSPSLLFGLGLLFLGGPVFASLCVLSFLSFSLCVLLILGLDFLQEFRLAFLGDFFSVSCKDPLFEHPSGEDLKHPPAFLHALFLRHGVLFLPRQ
jgi:hypothetical protein